MYKIIKNRAVLAITEAPNYIKLAKNGCFILCPEPEASGIVYADTVYHLLGREAMEGVESVTLDEIDGGDELRKASDATGITFVTLAESGRIDDVTAGEHANFFAPWVFSVKYKTGQIRRYDDKLYRCLSDHESQEMWTPDESPSLWVSMTDPSEEWPVWSQPVGSTDAYAAGVKVSHKGKHWVSDTDDNVWEPGVYGWTEQEV